MGGNDMHPFDSSPIAASSGIPDLVLHAFFKTWRGRRFRSLVHEGQGVLLVRQVFARAQASCNGLDPARKHAAGELYGMADWDTLPQGMRVCAGICLAYLVDNGQLPLKVHWTPSGKGKRHYWLSPRSPSSVPAPAAPCLPAAMGRNELPDDIDPACPY